MIDSLGWYAAYPEILLLVMACVIALVDLGVKTPQRGATHLLTLLTLGVLAVVAYVDAPVPAVLADEAFNAGPRGGAGPGLAVLDGIAYEVDHGPVQQPAVALDYGFLLGQLEVQGHMLGAGLGPAVIDGLVEQQAQFLGDFPQH